MIASWPLTARILGLQAGLGLVGLAGEPHAACSFPSLATWAVCLTVLLGLQWLHSTPSHCARLRKWKPMTLALHAVCTFLPMAVWEAEWPGMAGFLAGTAANTLGRRSGWAAFAATAVCSWVMARVVEPHALDSWVALATTVTIGLVVRGALRDVRLTARIRADILAMDRRARQEECERIARELHDRFTNPLTAVTLKSEMTRRALPEEQERTRRQLQDIASLTREVLTELRATAGGYRDLSLRDELEYARRLLTDTGIEVAVWNDVPAPDRAAAEVLAIAVREGVANMLRHSDATRCSIQVRQLYDGGTLLTMGNDGIRPADSEAASTGAGLHNLSLRATSIGGTARATVLPKGWFTLTVTCPAPLTERLTAMRAAATRLPGPGAPRPDAYERRA
ncbi:sensor histidine kinase [Streptomyces blastmyceticus]|uniref:Signal transduction histidine kinase subgroup 3 dimerisation and phosphoacceptor domain-containing protein n=1 Tax=Streptomyces blastmyceticus TaxID=68180 RepID=A0ABP3G052_9ACTN